MRSARRLPPLAAMIRRRLQAWPLVHAPLRRLVRLAMRDARLAAAIERIANPGRPGRPPTYARWVRTNDRLTAADRAAIRAAIPRLPHRPLISLVMPAGDTEATLVRAALASVQRQIYPHWELCIAGPAAPATRGWQALSRAAAADARVTIARPTRNGITEAVNTALRSATGEFVAIVAADAILAEQALFEVAAAIGAAGDVDILYADEDAIDARGRRAFAYLKPAFDAELLLGQDLIGPFGLYRRTLLETVGGFRTGFEGSQSYDLALRATERTTAARICHIPAVLAHRREAASALSAARGADAARQAVAEHLRRIGIDGADVRALPGPRPWIQIRHPLPDPLPLVSAIIPTRDGAALLRGCVDGLLRHTDYPLLEILVVDNGSRDPETLSLLRALSADARVRILRDEAPFNFAALNNRAAAEARGEILLLLNNDIAVIEPGWLRALVAQAVRPEVGAVGARLLYADGRVQHAGIILGVGEPAMVAAHLHAAAARADPGYFGHLVLARQVSAVTAACMALRCAVFRQAGGFDADRLKIAFNDVDLCLKIRALGYRVLWTPLAELYHLESASRGSDLTPERAERFAREVAVMRERWGPVLDDDPFYGPHFSRSSSHYELAMRSRRTRPWDELRPPVPRSRN